MTFSQLENFIHAAERLSFSAAAEELFLTPSALSKSVGQLERELCVQLFDRRYHELRLTEYGSLLYENGKLVADSFHRLSDLCHMFRSDVHGTVSILGAGTYPPNFIEAFNRFSLQYPHILWTNDSISRGSHRQIVSDILGRRYDLGITYRSYLEGLEDECRTLPLQRDVIAVLVGKNHPLGGESSVTLRQLSQQSVLWAAHMMPDTLTLINARLAQSGLPALRTVDMTPRHGTGRDVLMQLALGKDVLLAPYLIGLSNIECSLLRIADCELPQELVLFWRADNPNPTAQMFLRYVAENLPPETAV